MKDDLDFAVKFALTAGFDLRSHRRVAVRRTKPDGTSVTDVEEAINRTFIGMVRQRENIQASVQGEEFSSIVPGARRLWTIDPNDGTSEYLDDSVSDERRTSCIGISLFEDGWLKLAVVHSPFRDETFVASGDQVRLGRTVRPGRLAWAGVNCNSLLLRPNIPYDYCYWDGAPFDVRRLEARLGPPIGSQSAIYQAAMVADGRSAFAIFPGNTLHDIAPGALLVGGPNGLSRSRGRVTDLRGNPLDWNDLRHGVLFANRLIHHQVVEELAALM